MRHAKLGRSGLDVLAAGPIPPNPADLLATTRFEAILRLDGARLTAVPAP